MVLLGKSWKYLGEGNAHIVLKTSETKYVIRLIKEDTEVVDLTSVQTSIAFVNTVMIPLLANNNYPKYDVIEIPAQEIHEITKLLDPIRPSKRKIKSKLSRFAVKAPNLLIVHPSLSVNYCVEIKPKEGFLSPSLKDSQKCYYCLKQFFKLKENQIDKISEYCPLDLFSGDKGRMRYALSSLIKNPQNNFKLFKDEEIVFGEKSSENDFNDVLNVIPCFKGSIQLFIDFIVETLLFNTNKYGNTHAKCDKMFMSDIKEEKCVENNTLPIDSFLYKLLFVQKLSEKYDLQCSSLDIKNKEYVTTVLEQIELHNLNLSNDESREFFLSTIHPHHLAMISAVAKDCSVMISFSPGSAKEFAVTNVGDSEISYRVAVTDLEPKSAKSLIKRKDTERKMLEIYEKYVATAGKGDLSKYLCGIGFK